MKSKATPNPQDEAFVYLESFDKKTRHQGEVCFRDGKVKEIRLVNGADSLSIEAVVGGMQTHRVVFTFSEDGWDGECTCPVSFDCKHCYAAMLEADEIELLKGDAAKAPKTEEAPSTFLKIARQQLGRSLSPSEMRASNAVDNLYELFKDEEEIEASLLVPIFGERVGQEKMVTLWPEAPESPWQAWLYVVAYMVEHGLSCALQPLMAVEEAKKLVAPWHHQQKLEHWHAWLKKAANRVPVREQQKLELRVRLAAQGAQLEAQKQGGREFSAVKSLQYSQLQSASQQGTLPLEGASLQLWQIFNTGYDSTSLHPYGAADTARVLNQLIRLPSLEQRVVGHLGQPLVSSDESLSWQVTLENGNYRFALVLPGGAEPPPALVLLDGTPSLYLAREKVFTGPPLGSLAHEQLPVTIPAEALESADGIALLDRLEIIPPEPLASKMRTLRLRVVFNCRIEEDELVGGERLITEVTARNDENEQLGFYGRDGWNFKNEDETSQQATRIDSSALHAVPALVEALRLVWDPYVKSWRRNVGRQFAELFSDWLAALPGGVETELDPLLATFRQQPIEAQLKLDVQEAGIDWFDLKIMLDVADARLTSKELKALLDAQGGFVRLGSKGWARLQFELSEEEERNLADLGLSAQDFSSTPQRMHALQLAGRKATKRMFSADQAELIERRATDILTRVTPPTPEGLHAQLRPYQVEGYHFLAYLAANSFGGILADDMGLGKTLQTLAWLLHTREQENPTHPALVVCPKSVTATWAAETVRFAPMLRLKVLERGANKASVIEKTRADADLIVVNYAQLRLLEKAIKALPWHSVILDEAQYIKNPQSQTARAAFALKAKHRLALSGTPIENQLFDLWSIMNFAMPGVLGPQNSFKRSFDQRNDSLARRRLAARVRPFVLRRTKGEVAKDLPERTEEDLLCELEGEQATLYSAELKQARAALLRIQSQVDLDRERFHILTSLLRLRQICCHPALVSPTAAQAESAKFSALMDLLEPLVQEGHKVLVFSQFVQMLKLIQSELKQRDWKHFILTGETEERAELVDEFQAQEGSAVFLISLRAGGFGLNLTAASYVVLFDPWWNPAVENQAIDRTHRIGQSRHVIAYRLLMKSTIEEKIRELQKQKHALAEDILGEESLTRALTLDDFRFLLGDEE